MGEIEERGFILLLAKLASDTKPEDWIGGERENVMVNLKIPKKAAANLREMAKDSRDVMGEDFDVAYVETMLFSFLVAEGLRSTIPVILPDIYPELFDDSVKGGD